MSAYGFESFVKFCYKDNQWFFVSKSEPNWNEGWCYMQVSLEDIQFKENNFYSKEKSEGDYLRLRANSLRHVLIKQQKTED